MVTAPESQGQDKASQHRKTMQNTLASGQRVGRLSVDIVSGTGISLA
jgi:hypothetical protein